MSAVNGWPAPPSEPVHLWNVGADIAIALLDNYAGYCMAHYAFWYDDDIEKLVPGQTFGGIRTLRPPRGQTVGVTNHAAYLAMDLNSLKHKQGDKQLHLNRFALGLIHHRLYWMDRVARGSSLVDMPTDWNSNKDSGIVRWGFDYQRAPKDGMHYEWNKSPAGRVAGQRLAAHLQDTPRGQALIRDNPHSRYVRRVTR